MDRSNVIRRLRRRENGHAALSFSRNMQVTHALIKRLGLERVLRGHQGCVNCLQWNDRGELLASGSDDCQIIVWDPFRGKQKTQIQSGHQGNIFSVKFVPGTNDSVIASGAADFKVFATDLIGKENLLQCSCHLHRVKRLATTKTLRQMFWSTGEDGYVREFDLRIPHRCNKSNNVLLDLNQQSYQTEIKCIDINPMRPELMAIGCNDPWIRLFDRRMIKAEKGLSSLQYELDDDGDEASITKAKCKPQNLTSTCAKYFIPGHLPSARKHSTKKFHSIATTYVCFSNDGSELLANLGAEQIYLFNVLKPDKPRCYTTPTNGHKPPERVENSFKHHELPPTITVIKEEANALFEKGDPTSAIDLYNCAIDIHPSSAVLFANRAAALLKRDWDGDVYAALRDCYESIRLDPNYRKAHYRMIRCFIALKWVNEAIQCFADFRHKYPDQSKLFPDIEKEINRTVESSKPKEVGSTANGNVSIISDSYFLRIVNQINGGDEVDRDESQEGAEQNEPEANDTTNDAANDTTNDTTAQRNTDHDSNDEDERSDRDELVDHYAATGISELEADWQNNAYDYKSRYCGHCNTTTDIKEASFFGSNNQYIVAGSDDGSFFVWNKETCNLVRVMKGDDSIVNCLQAHPTCCLLATSGIDPVVRIWTPYPEDGSKNAHDLSSRRLDAAIRNQRRMNANPVEAMLMSMGYGTGSLSADDDENDEDAHEIVNCRQS